MGPWEFPGQHSLGKKLSCCPPMKSPTSKGVKTFTTAAFAHVSLPSFVLGWPNTLLPFTSKIERKKEGREGERGKGWEGVKERERERKEGGVNLYIKQLFLSLLLAWV